MTEHLSYNAALEWKADEEFVASETLQALSSVVDKLIARGLRTPEFLITNGGAGLERVLAALWPDMPAQRCTDRTTHTQLRGFGQHQAVAARR